VRFGGCRVIEDADWTDPLRLEARVAGVVARNRERLSDPVLAPAAFRRLVEELSRALGAAGIRRPEPLLGRVQHVQHAEMALIFGIKGREVFRRALCELLDVEALEAGSRQRHRGRNEHLESKETDCNHERRSEHWLFRHGVVSEVAEAPWGSSDRAAVRAETLS
jgi:hypothetical protein